MSLATERALLPDKRICGSCRSCLWSSRSLWSYGGLLSNRSLGCCWRRFRCCLCLRCHFLLKVLLREHSHPAIGGVGKNVTHYLCDLRLQFLDKLCRIIFLVLYVTQFLLPYTREFATLQQFLAYEVNQFDTRGCGDKVFPLALDIMALEECLDDTCPR